MIILDENIAENQRQLLRSWRISVRCVGIEIGQVGIKDDAIIPLLHELRRPTFFTRDSDFYKANLRHAGYCLAYLAVDQYEAATFIRKVLRHHNLNTQAKRMGKIIRVSHDRLFVWQLRAEIETTLGWD
jgi:hypothetical protein